MLVLNCHYQGNETFRLVEPEINRRCILSSNVVGVQDKATLWKNIQCQKRSNQLNDTSGTYNTSDGLLLTREGLSRAQVLGQVDNKFVACLVAGCANIDPNDSGYSTKKPTLILVDQHAADERVRVEVFLKELCSSFVSGKDSITQRILRPPNLFF